MKHFIGILAHKNPESVLKLVELLRMFDVEIAIHWDQRSESLLSEFPTLQQYCIPSIKVYRGHISLVRATKLLMKEAQTRDADYFHLISGEDLPCKSPSEWTEFFEQNKGLSFMDHTRLPLEEPFHKSLPLFSKYPVQKDHIPLEHYRSHFLKNGEGMYQMKHFRPGSFIQRLIAVLLKYRSLQRLYATIFKHKSPGYKIFAGSAWFSVHKELLAVLIQESSEERMAQFSHCFFPDELFFQTLAMNFGNIEKIIDSDLRYIHWPDGSHFPAILGQNDLIDIGRSNGFFARKWKFEEDLLDKIRKELLHV